MTLECRLCFEWIDILSEQFLLLMEKNSLREEIGI